MEESSGHAAFRDLVPVALRPETWLKVLSPSTEFGLDQMLTSRPTTAVEPTR